jgi:hypothetical protein
MGQDPWGYQIRCGKLGIARAANRYDSCTILHGVIRCPIQYEVAKDQIICDRHDNWADTHACL